MDDQNSTQTIEFEYLIKLPNRSRTSLNSHMPTSDSLDGAENEWDLVAEDYEILSQLRIGTFGEVKKCRNKVTN